MFFFGIKFGETKEDFWLFGIWMILIGWWEAPGRSQVHPTPIPPTGKMHSLREGTSCCVAIAMVHAMGICRGWETIGERHLGEQWNTPESSILTRILSQWHPYPTFSTARFSEVVFTKQPSPQFPVEKVSGNRCWTRSCLMTRPSRTFYAWPRRHFSIKTPRGVTGAGQISSRPKVPVFGPPKCSWERNNSYFTKI